MADYSRLTRAGIRRLAALYADARRLPLLEVITDGAVLGSLPWETIQRRLRAYLFDPAARSIGDDDPQVTAWLDESLVVERLAPGNGAPLSDELAALLVGPGLVSHEGLGGPARRWRFSARADDAIAVGLATLPDELASAEIARLAESPGPDEAILHLALLQAGRALAWANPAVLGTPSSVAIVERLLALLVRESPEPLLDRLVDALGPVAATATPIGGRVREATLAMLRQAMGEVERPQRPSASFLADLQRMDRPRRLPDEDHYLTLPQRRLAEAAAQILGRAVPADPGVFATARRAVIDERVDVALLPAFLQGLADAAAIAPLAEFVRALLGDEDEDAQRFGLGLAAQVPLDGCAEEIVARLGEGSPGVRAAAVRAVVLLEPEVAVPALLARLGDEAAEVALGVAWGLGELGQGSLARAWLDGATVSPRQRGLVLVGLGDVDPEAVGEVLQAIFEAASGDEDLGESPLVERLGALLRRRDDGLRLAASLIQELPEALPVVALAVAGSGREGFAPAISIPPALRAELDAVLGPLIEQGGDQAALALSLLCRLCAGDRGLVAAVGTGIEECEGFAGELLTALADLRVRSDEGAAILRPFLEDEDHLAARLTAAAVAGLALPADSTLWSEVKGLLPLGTVGAAAAWAALANGARVASADRQL